jgi:superfamily II DNA/RNA helicase
VSDACYIHFINLFNFFQDYIHRIGRTGRGDKKGISFTFVTQFDLKILQGLTKILI